eukprot:scaffold57409_cov63-Phaeocystis_antarctica.AAC.1
MKQPKSAIRQTKSAPPAVIRDALVDAEREVAPEDGVGQQPRRHVEGLESGPGLGLELGLGLGLGI